MEQRIRVLVLLAALSSVGTAQDLRYFTDGSERTFEVRPPVTGEITAIIWKFNGDRVADWFKDIAPLEIYPRFKTRSSLNTSTAILVIKDMTKDDAGGYSVEINNKLQSGKYDMKWIRKVNKPEVNIRACWHISDKCTVTCDGGTEEAEPIDYDWRIGTEWKNLTKDIEITKVDHGGEKDITCRMKNPVGEAESKPVNNPLYSLQWSEIVLIVVCLLVLVLLVLLIGLCRRKKRSLKTRDTQEPKPTNPSSDAEKPILSGET
ncbi:SLAM family member 9 [Gasterosteus aculeatus]